MQRAGFLFRAANTASNDTSVMAQTRLTIYTTGSDAISPVNVLLMVVNVAADGTSNSDNVWTYGDGGGTAVSRQPVRLPDMRTSAGVPVSFDPARVTATLTNHYSSLSCHAVGASCVGGVQLIPPTISSDRVCPAASSQGDSAGNMVLFSTHIFSCVWLVVFF